MPELPEGYPKGSHGVSREALGGCWGRSFGAVEPPSGHSGSLFGTTWRPKQSFLMIFMTFFNSFPSKKYKETTLFPCIIMGFQRVPLGFLLAQLGEPDAEFGQFESPN